MTDPIRDESDTDARPIKIQRVEVHLDADPAWTPPLKPLGRASPLPIPASVGLEVVSSKSERSAPAVAGVRFFPDGASSGATIRLGPAGKAREIRINWFTGRVIVVPPS